MPYVAPHIDETGLHIPTYEDIRNSLVDKFKEIYGNDIYLENDSQDYQMISAFALMVYDSNQALVYAYNNSNVVTAVGASLDRLVALNGISRKEKSFSSVTLKITGVAGTVLSYCSAKDINGNIWQMDPELTIPIGGILETEALCSVPGPVQAGADTITIIATPTTGWVSVTNELPAIPGNVIETDSLLRARRVESVSLPSMTVFEGIVADIKQLASVTRVKGYENDTGNTVDTIPPHAIAIVVEGGEDTDIANIIYLRKTPGVGTFGSTTVIVMGEQQTENAIKFSRPEYVPLTIAVSIKTLDNWNAAIENDIKANIMDYVSKMNIGESLYVSSLSTPIMNANPDFSKLSFYMTGATVNAQTEVVAISKFEVTSLSIEDITITIV